MMDKLETKYLPKDGNSYLFKFASLYQQNITIMLLISKQQKQIRNPQNNQNGLRNIEFYVQNLQYQQFVRIVQDAELMRPSSLQQNWQICLEFLIRRRATQIWYILLLFDLSG
ncbi:unnamed protein product [Paramecium octaurelia]|uniref:Uncharacterized protein n=1 Tax=Paramecium octaurelia TaxID=43137 RepID=A0A8S1X9N1_PAROT|nr:unnamed protein product [Paramecium octaurelia]